MGEEPDALIRTAASALRSEQLLSFLMGQRWFGAKGLSPTHVAIGDCIVLPWGNSRYAIARLVVGGAGGERVYQLPLGVREVASPTSSETTIANLEHDGRTLAVYDAAHDEDFRAGLVDALVGGATIQEGETRWVAEAIHADWDPGNRSTSVGSAEQSNTSIVIGGRAIYKLFRSLMPGIHPDVEVTRFLTTTAGFPNVPALLAETRIEAAGQMLTTGMAQEFLPGSSDAWSFALERGRAYFAAPAAVEPKNEFITYARRLGVVTRAMHDALASGTETAFAPEALDPEDLERWAHRVQQSIRESLTLLGAQTEAGRIPVQRVAEARALTSRAEHHLGLIDEVVDTVGADLGSRIRTHGDYHLGQVLHTASDDFMVIDFEGEPARPLEERRQKTSPLRDVAGMLRSFAYVAATLATSAERAVDAPTRELRAARWERDVRAAFLAGYLDRAPQRPAADKRAALLPSDEANTRRLIGLFETEKAFYELSYELNNRPAWVWIPMRGISKLLVG